jgi:hypothetical protein
VSMSRAECLVRQTFAFAKLEPIDQLACARLPRFRRRGGVNE